MIRSTIRILLIFLVFNAQQLTAQDEEVPFMQTDTLEVIKKTQIVGLPIMFYTPETAFGVGGGVQFIFQGLRNVFNSRLSDMVVTAVYTSKNQLLIDARPQIHIYDGEFYLEGIFRYKIFPNTFWGIGNRTIAEEYEQYNMESTEIHALLLKRIPPDLNFGFEYIFQNHKMLEFDPEGKLIHQDIPGSEGAIISSLTGAFTFDDRDNVYSAHKGNYFKLMAGFSSQVMGATYSYNKYRFDLRKYIPVASNLSLASQVYIEMTYGDIPFQTKAWLGGGERTRGYFRGRYIDNQFYALQTELRWRFAKRWILAGYISGGEVAEYLADIFGEVKPSYGGGLRFQLSKKSPTLVRLDFGIGTPGNSGIYFGVNEAF